MAGRLPFGDFFLTAVVGSAFAAALLATALWISLTFERSTLNAREALGTLLGAFLSVLVLVAAFEVQPALLRRFYTGYDAAAFGLASFGHIVPRLGATLAAASAMLIPPAQKLANVVKAQAGEATWSGWTSKALGWAALALAGIAVPILLWVGYLYLAFWALRPERPFHRHCCIDAVDGDRAGRHGLDVEDDSHALSKFHRVRGRSTDPNAPPRRLHLDLHLRNQQHSADDRRQLRSDDDIPVDPLAG